MNIVIPPLVIPPPPAKPEPVLFKHGDVVVLSMGPNVCIKVSGVSYVDPSPSNKIGASGKGGAHAYLPLPEAERLLESLTKMIARLKS